MITIKGYEFGILPITSAHDRRAIQYRNKIIATLKKIGVSEDDIIFEESMALKNTHASVCWFMENSSLYYNYKRARNHVENLFVVSKIVEFKVNDLIENKITMNEFLDEFSENKDIEEQRIQARETLGVDIDSSDIALIDQKYKELAKIYHPDMTQGDLELFKKINNAHKMLKRELL